MVGVSQLMRRHRRFLTFCAVGGSGVVVNMIVFALVLRAWPDDASGGRDALTVNVAGLLGWLVSVLTNYALNERLTFADHATDDAISWWRRAGRYYVSATAALAVQLAVLNSGLWLLDLFCVDQLVFSNAWLEAGRAALLRWAPEVCNLTGIASGTIANYLLAKRWVFK